MRMFEDQEPLSPEEKERMEAIGRLRENNLKIIQEGLTGKRVVLKSNVDRKERVYLVDEVKDEYIKGAGGRLIRGMRLANKETSPEEQPFLKYPAELIEKATEGNQQKLTLLYSSELNINRDFRRLHRDTKQDLEIYIYY